MSIESEEIKMLDNPTNQTQNHINFDQVDIPSAADGVVAETRKPWRLPTLERALLSVIGFLAFFLAFRAGRAFVEWQFGLTIVLAAVIAVVIPVLSRENKRVTSELNDEPFCPCFVCSIEYLLLVGVGLITVLAVWIAGKTTYKLVAGLGGLLIIFFPILYLENDRVSRQLSEETAAPRNFIHALTFLGLTIIVGGIGWISGTATRTFIEIAVPKVTLL